jgi:rhodanese-related sulfurtransferase
MIHDIPLISPKDVLSQQRATLVDVRMPEEYVGELGHIAGATLKTLGPELDEFLGSVDKNKTLIFICRSGARSGRATGQAMSLGFKKIYNMEGGMLAWNALALPTENKDVP